MQKKNETRRDGIYDSLYREICAEEDAKVMALLEASIIDHERKKKMRVDHKRKPSVGARLKSKTT